MLLIDKPLVSDFVKDSIQKGLFTALDTGNILQDGELDILSEEAVIMAFRKDPGQRLHTISENSIAWIERNLSFTSLPNKIRLFKDKYLFRKLVQDLYPELYFGKFSIEALKNADKHHFNYPLIIKPNVGFFSMGVHKVFSADEMDLIIEKISRQVDHMKDVYPEAVLNTAEFIIEDCIEGEEYAVDAYFDEKGDMAVLGLMHHLFGGEEDVSDRVYLTSAEIMEKNLHRFDPLLNEIGNRAGLKNFSLHLELRIDENGKATPIEVNPLRFGAWCTSADLMNYAYGFNPYEYYIKGLKPDWDQIIATSDGQIYSINIFENSTPFSGKQIKAFDFDRMLNHFSQPIELRKIDFSVYPIFGILFARTHPDSFSEIKNVLFAKMEEFVEPA
jgi:hypothetical protein